MELKRDDVALVDRVEVNNIVVQDIIDMNHLVEKGIVTIKVGQKYYIPTISGDCFSSLRIGKNEYFNQFEYSIGVEGYIYARLQLSVEYDEFHNLNCMSCMELKERLICIKEYLEREYGIIIEVSNARIIKMEINKTIVLDYSYERYHRVLHLMSHNLPGRLRLKGEGDYKSKDSSPGTTKRECKPQYLQTISKGSGKRGIHIEVYDKKAQLKRDYKINLGHECLRFELTLNSPKKVRDALGTDIIAKLSDERVNEYFNDFISENIDIPRRKYMESCRTELKKTFKACYTSRGRNWVYELLLLLYDAEISRDGIPVLLDIKQVVEMLPEINKIDRKWRSRMKKRLYDSGSICGGSKRLQVFFSKDDTKYEELVCKLLNRNAL